MVKIDPFEVDHWILTRHASAKHSLAHSYCASLSINDIQLYSEGSNDACTSWSPLLSKAMGYGPMQGSEDLRSKISNLYSDKSSEDGDHVIVQYPTYQQLYSVPASVGADVSLWKANDGEGWRLDLDELKQLIKPNTKMIVINNPVNPTGAAISKTTLEAIVRIASERSIIVFCDEVYYPLFHSIEPTDPELPPSILSLGYKNTIATGSLSKTYSLPGLRVGWIASRNSSYIDTCVNARSYALITLSQVDESLGALALSTPIVQNLMKRNITLSRHNLDVVQSFIDKNSFTKSGRPVDDVDFCTRLLDKKGVLLVPGSKCFGNGSDFQGYVRLGFGVQTEDLKAALDAFQRFLDEDYANVPVV
ncbi:pyridoxal phosphate-dependent transferase [Aspergillus similis]